MSFLKGQLKAAREAIQSKSFEYAREVSNQILVNDPSNYTGLVFLAVALQELEEIDEASVVYHRAIASNPTAMLAYQGLLKLNESQNDLNATLTTLELVGRQYMALGDGAKYLDGLQRQISICATLHDTDREVYLLRQLLPNSNEYPLVKDHRIPNTKTILLRILDIKEDMIKNEIEKEIQVRRMRLGSEPLVILSVIVEGEVIRKSDINQYYNLLSHYGAIKGEEGRYIRYLVKKVSYSDMAEKDLEREKLFKVTQSSLESEYSAQAIEIFLESQNNKLCDIDISGATHYEMEVSNSVEPYSKIVDCLLKYRKGDKVAIEVVQEALKINVSSGIGHAILSKLLLESKDYQKCIEVCDTAISVIRERESQMKIDLSLSILDIRLSKGQSFGGLGGSFLTLGLTDFKGILEDFPSNEDSILGAGRILLELGLFQECRKYFELLPAKAGEELSWLSFLDGHLEAALEGFKGETGVSLYRIARVYSSLKNKEKTHSNLIKAIRLDSSYAPSFTYLGHYYRDVESDFDRAIKCYSKSISIDPLNSEPVEALADLYLDQNKVNSSIDILLQYQKAQPRSFFCNKRLGILFLSLSMLEDATACLQSALRVKPDDSVCWTSLGEAYGLQGKYLASLKALDRAALIDPLADEVTYFKAFVNVKLMNYQQAIREYSSLNGLVSLKGLVETKRLYATELFEQGAYGAAKASLLDAISIGQRGLESISITKIFADSLIDYFKYFKEDYTFDDCSQAYGTSGLEAACYWYKFLLSKTKPYEKSILAGLSYDISLTYNYLNNRDEAAQYCSLALELEPGNSTYWEGLAMYSDEASLSQHCFIKAIECDLGITTNWSNLGYFYLLQKDFELAKTCFLKSQFHDLDNPVSWFGEALTEHSLGLECYDLFDHSYKLATLNPKYFDILYAFGKHSFQSSMGLQDASFALLKCSEMKNDPCALNLYGLVLELQNQSKQAIEAFEKAIMCCSDEAQLKLINENLGRVFCAESRYVKSIEAYKNSTKLAKTALPYFFNSDYELALEAFQISIDDNPTVTLNLNLSQILFALGQDDMAKERLLLSFEKDPNHVDTILSLCVLGIVTEDSNLADLAASELLKLDPSNIKDTDIYYVLSCLNLLKGDLQVAKRFHVKGIHCRPWQAERWTILSRFLYSYIPSASSLAQSALAISNDSEAQVYAETRLRVGIASMQNGDLKLARRLLSKAILIQPSNGKNWLALSLLPDTPTDIVDVVNTLNRDEDSSDLAWSELISFNSKLLDGTVTQDDLEGLDTLTSGLDGLLQHNGFLLIGRALDQMDNKPAAVQAFKQAILLSSVLSPSTLAWYCLGETFKGMSDITAAKFCFSAADQIRLA